MIYIKNNLFIFILIKMEMTILLLLFIKITFSSEKNYYIMVDKLFNHKIDKYFISFDLCNQKKS